MVFDFSFDEMLTIKHKRMKTRTKSTFFGDVVFGAVPSPPFLTAPPPLPSWFAVWAPCRPLFFQTLPNAAIRRATAAATAAAAVPTLALGVRTVGGVWICQHCYPRAQFGDLFVTQLEKTRVQLRLGQGLQLAHGLPDEDVIRILV